MKRCYTMQVECFIDIDNLQRSPIDILYWVKVSLIAPHFAPPNSPIPQICLKWNKIFRNWRESSISPPSPGTSPGSGIRLLEFLTFDIDTFKKPWQFNNTQRRLLTLPSFDENHYFGFKHVASWMLVYKLSSLSSLVLSDWNRGFLKELMSELRSSTGRGHV